jgi:hypothetical protein
MATKSDEVLCININQQFPYVETPDDLYNVTRGIWWLDKERTEKARYLFSVYQGVIGIVKLTTTEGNWYCGIMR